MSRCMSHTMNSHACNHYDKKKFFYYPHYSFSNIVSIFARIISCVVCMLYCKYFGDDLNKSDYVTV